jgi:hypothetical protein
VKFLRGLSRIAILSLAAAVFVGLTGMYGRSAHPPSPDRRSQAERLHRPPLPQAGYFLEFLSEGALLAVFAWAGRIAFRLRLNSISRREGQPIVLNLYGGRRETLKSSAPPTVPFPPVR